MRDLGKRMPCFCKINFFLCKFLCWRRRMGRMTDATLLNLGHSLGRFCGYSDIFSSESKWNIPSLLSSSWLLTAQQKDTFFPYCRKKKWWNFSWISKKKKTNLTHFNQIKLKQTMITCQKTHQDIFIIINYKHKIDDYKKKKKIVITNFHSTELKRNFFY